MLLLIWFVVGLLLGRFVNRQALALGLAATLWVISGATAVLLKTNLVQS